MVFTSQPIALNVQYNQQRLGRVKGSLVSVYNLPLTLAAYLAPANIKFAGTFPWIFPTMGDPALASRFPKAHFDATEPFASAPAAMPELFLGAIAGLVLCLARRRELRDFRAPMCGAVAGCGLIFAWGYITYRNLHDMFPWLVLGCAVAVAYLPAIPGTRLRYGLAGLFAAATLYALASPLRSGGRGTPATRYAPKNARHSRIFVTSSTTKGSKAFCGTPGTGTSIFRRPHFKAGTC